MKNTKKLFAMMLMLASVLFFACDDDEKDTLSSDEAQQELSNLNTEMTTVMNDMQTSDGMAVFQMLISLPDPFEATDGTKSSKENDVLGKIENYLLPNTMLSKEKSVTGEVAFDFDAYKGVYTYINEYPYWTVTRGGDVIEINFPTTEANQLSGTNDGQLTIFNYEETLITETDDYWGTYTYYSPTALDVEATVNDVKIIDIYMSAAWVTSGDAAGEPTSLDVDVYVIPFNFHVDFSHSGTAADINAWIEYDGEKIFSVGLDADFEDATMDSPTKIYGYIQLFDVKFKATVKVKELEALMEAQEADIPLYTDIEEFEVAFNALINAEVEVNGAKAADIVADFTTNASQYSITVDDENGIYVNIMFVYGDGTTEAALPYFASFLTMLNGLLDGLDSYYSGF